MFLEVTESFSKLLFGISLFVLSVCSLPYRKYLIPETIKKFSAALNVQLFATHVYTDSPRLSHKVCSALS